MRSGPYENHEARRSILIQAISQNEVTTNMALPMPLPLPFERMVRPFRPERAIVGDQKHHHSLELVHIIAT